MIIQQCGEDTCHQTGSLGHSWNPMIHSHHPLCPFILRTKRDKELRVMQAYCPQWPFRGSLASWVWLRTWSVIWVRCHQVAPPQSHFILNHWASLGFNQASPTTSTPAPGREHGGSPSLWAQNFGLPAQVSSSLCFCPFISQSLWLYLPQPLSPGSLALINLPLPGPNFLQALPNPAVQLNLLPESQPAPWIRSHLSLVSGTPSSILLCLLQGSPCKSTKRSRGRLSFLE